MAVIPLAALVALCGIAGVAVGWFMATRAGVQPPADPVSANYKDDLLRDAKLVVAFAVRVGRLPDENLPNAIDAVDLALSAGGTPNWATLEAALSKGVADIAPMTLLDLREGRYAFDPRGRQALRHIQLPLTGLIVVLVVAAATLTQVLNLGDDLLARRQEILKAQPLDKLHALRKLAQNEAVYKESTTEHTLAADQYDRAVSQFRELKAAMDGSSALITNITSFTVRNAVRNVLSLGSSNDNAENAYEREYRVKAGLEPPPNKSESVANAALEPTGSAPREPESICTPVAVLKDPDAARFPWLMHAIKEMNDDYCFAVKLNLLPVSSDDARQVYAVQSTVTNMKNWILPACFGLLGATVFVMRNLLDPRTPIMAVMPSVARIALGGIAGVAAGWFMTSNVGDVATLKSVPFALAFLAGFSLDILFSFLDRWSRTVTQLSAPKAAS